MSDIYSEKRVRKIIREEFADIYSEQRVREIVRDEVADIRQEQYRQAVLLEDVQSDLKTVLEMLSANLTVKKQVSSHGERLGAVETTQSMLVTTVKAHSRKLKPI